MARKERPNTETETQTLTTDDVGTVPPVQVTAVQPPLAFVAGTGGLSLSVPTNVRKFNGGRPGRFPIEQLAVNGFFLVGEGTEVLVRRAIQQVKKKFAVPVEGEFRERKGKPSQVTRKTRDFVLFELDAAQKAGIADADLISLCPGATGREDALSRKIFACYRTM